MNIKFFAVTGTRCDIDVELISYKNVLTKTKSWSSWWESSVSNAKQNDSSEGNTICSL